MLRRAPFTIEDTARVTGPAWQSIFCILCFAITASAQSPTAPAVTALDVEQEGRPVTDTAITSLIETTVGKPLDVQAVRESIAGRLGAGG